MRVESPQAPLRVAAIDTSMSVGGQERATVGLLNGMNRERFRPALLLTKSPGPLAEFLRRDVVVASGFRLGPAGVLWALPRLYRWMREWRPDVVLTVGMGDKLLLGRIAARWAGVPVILSRFGATPGPQHADRSVIGTWNRHLMFLNTGVVVVSQDLRDRLIGDEGYTSERCHVIPNGVDTEAFRPAEPSHELRQELGLDPGHRVVSIIATLRPEKRHDLFLEAARQIADRMPEARFLVVGGGPLRGRYERLAEEYGIDHLVRFLGARHDIPELLATSDLVCLSSTDVESAPNCLLEAMAAGRSQVAPALAGIPQIVDDGVTGLLVPPGDTSALAEAVLRILSDSELQDRMGKASRRRAVEQFSLDLMIGRYERLIEDLCGGGRLMHENR